MARFGGESTAATGTITSSVASLLSFNHEKQHVIISNRSGQTAYFKINDSATPTVSNTTYDFVLSDGGTFIIEEVAVTTIGVYVAATSGIRVVGWD